MSKLKEMFNLLDPDRVYFRNIIDAIASIKGIGPNTANTIANEFKFFQPDVDWIIEHGNVKPFVRRNGKKIFFSGFRDKEFETFLNEHGFYCDQNASVNLYGYALIVPSYSYTSGNVAKAKKYGLIISTKADFLENIDKYM